MLTLLAAVCLCLLFWKLDGTYISVRFQWNGLYEEHGVLKTLGLRFKLSGPCNTYHAFFLLWSDESHVRVDLDGDWCGCVYKEGNRTVLYRVDNFEFGVEVPFLMLLEEKLILRCHIDEVRANVNGTFECVFICALVLVITRHLRIWIAIVV